MKTLLLSLALVIAFTTSAFASQFGNTVPFTNYSATSGTAVKSSAYNVRGFKLKTMTVQGIAVAAHAAAALSGTVLIECGPTSSGPWVTCAQDQTADGGAVSTTANAMMTWVDASPYIRASWAKTAGEVSVWLNWQE